MRSWVLIVASLMLTGSLSACASGDVVLEPVQDMPHEMGPSVPNSDIQPAEEM